MKPLARTSPVEGVRLGTAADELFAGPDVWKLVPDPGSEFMSVRWRRETPCTDIDVVDGIVCVVTFWEHCRLSGRELIGATFAELRSALGQPWIVDSVEPLVLELGDWCDVWIEDGVVRRVTFADYGSISD